MRTMTLRALPVVLWTLAVAACGEARAVPPPANEVPAATPAAFAEPAPPSAHAPEARSEDTGTKRSRPQRSVITFTDARKQTREFIGYFRSIKLTPEQERIKVAALSALPAPCCAKFSLATCCCPCNMSKAVWGMAAWLITEKGQGVEQVREAAVDWLAFINPNGFSGEACFKGGCKRPAAQDGCGGMDEAHLL